MNLHRFFFFATLILLPTQLGLHMWPDWSLVLGRRLDYLAPTIYGTDITVVLTIITWFISSNIFHALNLKFIIRNLKSNLKHKNLKHLKILFFKLNSNSKFQISNSSLFISLSLSVFIFLNIFLASYPLVAFSKWLKICEFAAFGFYIVKTKPSRLHTLWCLSFAVFYSSLIAISQFFLQQSVGGLLWFFGERTFDVTTPGIAKILIQPSVFSHQSSEMLRPYATFPHPNVLGGFLAITIPIIFSLSFLRKQESTFHHRFFLSGIIIIGSLALILTFSRSAWIAFILEIIAITLYNVYKKKKYSSVGLPAIVLAAAVLFIFAFPYFQSLTPSNESVFIRNELNVSAIKMITPSNYERFLFGVGLGNFLVTLPTYYPHREIFFLQPVHNIYLLLLAETGIIGEGLALYCIYLLLRLWTQRRVFSIWHLALGIILLLGLVDHYPLTLQQGQLLLTILLAFSFL